MKSPADRLILRNGRIFGGAGWSEPEWQEAVYLRAGTICAVGSKGELDDVDPPAPVIDLNGAMVLPGLRDAHIHIAAGGRSMSVVNLSGLDFKAATDALKDGCLASSTNDNEWLQAFNWDDTHCRLSADLLEGVMPGVPVIVHRRDLHSCVVSRSALDIAGIGLETPDPRGGRIGRGVDGAPDGALFEAAMKLVRDKLPSLNRSQRRRNILEAQRYLLSLGLTGCCEVLDDQDEPIYAELDLSGELSLYIDGWRRFEDWDGSPPPDNMGSRFQVGSLKIFLDGSFGSHTAALDEPYSDDPDNCGMMMYDDEELFQMLMPAAGLGWRIAAHAIGDRAVRQALQIFARLPNPTNERHRIEHMQLLPVDSEMLIAECRVAASAQPVHLLDDQPWLAERIGGERCRRSFCLRTMMDSALTLALGTDWPISSADPLLNLHAAINRCGFHGEPNPAFDDSQRLLPREAVRAATQGWAEAAGLEREFGAISAGMTADLTVVTGVSEDMMDWSEAEVLMTICKGEAVFD